MLGNRATEAEKNPVNIGRFKKSSQTSHFSSCGFFCPGLDTASPKRRRRRDVAVAVREAAEVAAGISGYTAADEPEVGVVRLFCVCAL